MELVLRNAAESKEDSVDFKLDDMRAWSRPGLLARFFIPIWMNLHMAVLALRVYGSISKTLEIFRHFREFNKKFIGKGRRKFSVINSQYWSGIYLPPFPSRNFDRFIISEMNRYIPHSHPVNAYQQVNFSITTRCPMRCEHCLEWDNLNQHETFTVSQLREIVGKLQNKGLAHISLTGGEPMVRFEDLIEIVETGSEKTEWWVLTSGFNLDSEKATRLKTAGLKGVVVSLDHYSANFHSKFRGHKDAFAHAIRAIKASKEAGLAVAVSVCITRENANKEFLKTYARFVARVGVDFIQWLEPKAEGHYRGKDVLLDDNQIFILEEVFKELNHSPRFTDIPPIIYHGYYQRRIGCLSGGKSSFYVDAAGMVHSCPFCHSADFKITDWLEMPKIGGKEITACKLY